MLIREIIDKLVAKNAIGTLDSRTFAAQQQVQAMLNPDNPDQPVNMDYLTEESLITDADKLKRQYKFFLTSGGMPKTFSLGTIAEAVYMEISRIGEIKICLRDEPFKEAPPILLQLSPEYVDDIDVVGTLLTVKTKTSKLAISLPDRSVYEYKGKNGRQT